MPVTNYTSKTFELADEDLKIANLLLKEGASTNGVAFHAQQAAEKYLKGFLASQEQHVRKVHSMEALLADCAKKDASFENLKNDAAHLDQFYTEARYADDFRHVTLGEAKQAIEAAERFKDFVREKLNL